MNFQKISEKINKVWIGYLYGYAIFICFFSFGVIIGFNSTLRFMIVCIWLFIISYAFILSITIIRRVIRKQEKDNNNNNNKE